MIGVWETTAKCRFTPGAPVFEGKSIATIYWSKSRQFLISDQRGLTPGGWVNTLQVTAWDPINKHYQIIELVPGGSSNQMVMTIEGNHGKVTGSQINGTHITRINLTFENISPTESHFRSECSIDDGPKWLFSEGVSKKITSDTNAVLANPSAFTTVESPARPVKNGDRSFKWSGL